MLTTISVLTSKTFNFAFEGSFLTIVLPGYFFSIIIGVKKSGTSDFYSRLKHHPNICTPSFPKESQWFSRFRFGIKTFSMNRRKVKCEYRLSDLLEIP